MGTKLGTVFRSAQRENSAFAPSSPSISLSRWQAPLCPISSPSPLKSKPVPFDHPDWIFELKYDGFRAVAHVENGRCQLISRNGATFASFSNLSADIATSLGSRNAVLDGEIVCLDSNGHPQFRDLLFHRGEPCFFCFDLLECDGKDFRLNALIERKAELRRILSSVPSHSRVRYLDHVDQRGIALFNLICQRDLEGIVAKLKHGHYVEQVDNAAPSPFRSRWNPHQDWNQVRCPKCKHEFIVHRVSHLKTS